MTAWATLDGRAPEVIAHRGASGEFPEHVLPGYQRALEHGADFIEPDLLASRDGVLFCRHDLGLARSTDIAARAGFVDRAIDGDWPIWALDAAELDALRCRQPFPSRSAAFDGQFPPPRFTDVLAWAGAAARRRGGSVRLYPELKHPAALREHGIDAVERLVEALQPCPPGVRVHVQCFDADALRRIHARTGLPCALLVDSRGDPAAALAAHAGWLDTLALSKKWLAGAAGQALIEAIHARGLRVDAWTFRDDEVGAGFADIEAELRWALQSGIDRLFCDFPATALRVRAALSAPR